MATQFDTQVERVTALFQALADDFDLSGAVMVNVADDILRQIGYTEAQIAAANNETKAEVICNYLRNVMLETARSGQVVEQHGQAAKAVTVTEWNNTIAPEFGGFADLPGRNQG